MGSRWVRTVYGAPPVGAAPTRGRMREGARTDAMVSRTTTATRERNLRVGRTRGTGKRDMRPQALGQRRPDTANPVERLHGSERAESRAFLHDPGRERRSDPGQALQFFDGGKVHIDKTRRLDGARRVGRTRGGRGTRAKRQGWLRWRGGGRVDLYRSAPPGPFGPRPTRPDAGDDGIDARKLVCERGARRGSGRGAFDRAPRAHAGAERGYRCDEDQGLAFCWLRHRKTLARSRAIRRTESLPAE